MLFVEFKDAEMANLFVKNLKCTGLTKTAFKATAKVKNVYIEWLSRYSII